MGKQYALQKNESAFHFFESNKFALIKVYLSALQNDAHAIFQSNLDFCFISKLDLYIISMKDKKISTVFQKNNGPYKHI